MTTNIIATVEKLQERTDYIAGLRALADALDEDTSLPLPYDGKSSALSVFTDTKAECLAYARLLGRADKKYTDSDSYGFELHGSLLGLSLLVYAPRDQVCTKVVLGTREVTEEIPDPTALAAVPTITVTKAVEDIRWECVPLLAEKSS